MKQLLTIFVISLFFLVSTAIAQEKVDVRLSQKSLIGYAGETQSIDVTLTNNQDKTDTFSLSIFPPQFEKVSASLESFLITLVPKEEETLKLFFTVAIDAELLSPVFTITTKSTSDEAVSDTENLILTIQRRTPVYIRDVTLDKYAANPGEEVKIKAEVFNLEDTLSAKYFLKIIVRKGEVILGTFDETIDALGGKSSLDVIKGFELDKYASPGGYVVETELRDINNAVKSTKSINFNVNVVTQAPTEYIERSSDYNVLFSLVTIKIKNEGNVELPAFTVTESVPRFAQTMFEPVIEPITTDSTPNRVIYTWSVPALAPGEQYTIPYRFAIWRIWLTLGVIGGAAYGVYRWLSLPRIVKGVRHEGEITRGKEILILLEAKNRALHEIRDVEVIDIIPPIARVVERFDTVRPKIRKVPDGTELRWSFDALKSGEERVLTYRIKPVVDVVGHLNLPEAQMFYFDRHKVKRMHASKQALVRAG